MLRKRTMNLTKIVLALVLVALGNSPLGAMKRMNPTEGGQPPKRQMINTQQQERVVNVVCGDNTKINNVPHKVLAQSPVLASMMLDQNCKEVQIGAPEACHQTIKILLSYMSLIAKRLSDMMPEDEINDDILTHLHTHKIDNLIFDRLCTTATVLECKLLSNALASFKNPPQFFDFHPTHNNLKPLGQNFPIPNIPADNSPVIQELRSTHKKKKALNDDENSAQEAPPKKARKRQKEQTPPKKNKPFLCTFDGCGQTLSSQSDLTTHERIHTGQRPFICTYPNCGKTFAVKSNLTRHGKIHLDEKTFECKHPGCTQAFATDRKLANHMQMHTGEKLFICTYPGCAKAFATDPRLTNHMKIHSSEKPFICTYPGCTKAFTLAGNLKNHMKVHTDEKCFICTYPGCNEGFPRKDYLTRHKRIVHDDDKVDPDNFLDSLLSDTPDGKNQETSPSQSILPKD